MSIPLITEALCCNVLILYARKIYLLAIRLLEVVVRDWTENRAIGQRELTNADCARRSAHAHATLLRKNARCSVRRRLSLMGSSGVT